MAHLEAHFATEHFKRLVPLMDDISESVSITTFKNAIAAERIDPVVKVLVLYDSSTSCTRKMAAIVAEGAKQLGQVEVRLRFVPGDLNGWDADGCRGGAGANEGGREAVFEDVEWADAVACGTPTNLGCVSWRMKKFWDDLSQSGLWNTLDGKVGCSFSSQGGDAGGGELVCMAMNAVLMNFGFAVFGVTDYVSFKKTLHYGAICAKAPRDELDVMACRRLGRRLAEFAAYYLKGRQDCHPLKSSKARDTARWGYPGIPPRDAKPEELVEMNKAPHGSVAVPPAPCSKAGLPNEQPSSLPSLFCVAVGVVLGLGLSRSGLSAK
eukprot:CAMPEP_0172606372 /NCGR_PEP_ID=MMETSP1068-20121228/26570_1 /TAXON_ID=35684 /ORGANISM="Pseudopedinella elastica, Strain CCMP716" /LENGTH=322 /DNA_ID=CAMNT_0013409055 /DNA_START=185 /DNA_END=1153 /DNA_ORIENTATION=+